MMNGAEVLRAGDPRLKVPGVRVVFNSKLARRLTPPRMVCVTLWSTIYDKDDSITVKTFLHELEHVRQFQRHRLTFPVRYLFENFLHNYTGNKYEAQAQIYAAAVLAGRIRSPLPEA